MSLHAAASGNISYFSWPNSIPLEEYTTHSLVICWWTIRLRPYLGNCKYCCYEHLSACINSNYFFFFFSDLYPEVQLLGHMVAEMVKNLLSVQETQFNFWISKICWRRDRLPTPVFLGLPGGSTGKESACNVGDLGLIPGLGRSMEKGKATHSVFWPGEFHGVYGP